MERRRALRASGVTGPQVDTVRFAEVSRAVLLMPSGAASQYNAASRPPWLMFPGTPKAHIMFTPGM